MAQTVDLGTRPHSLGAHISAFEHQGHRLTGVAHRIVGSRADDEDVLQDAWLRFSRVELGQLACTEAFLTKVITRLALDRRRTLARQREVAWMAALVEVGAGGDPQDQAQAAEALAAALLLVLRSLSPLERAVFVLHDAFDVPYDELARLMSREAPAVRQLIHRARRHLATRLLRFDADANNHAELRRRFGSACDGGDLDRLLAWLLGATECPAAISR